MGEVWVLLMVLNGPGNPAGSLAALSAEFKTQNKCISAASALMNATGTAISSSGFVNLHTVPIKGRFEVTFVCSKK